MKYLLPLVSLVTLSALTAGCSVERGTPTAPSSILQSRNSPSDPKGGGGGNIANSAKAPSEWTADEWRTWFFALTERRGWPNAGEDAMAALRADLNAVGADWQNGFRGDYRTRIYLPTGVCPPALTADVPGCSYDKPVDVGENGMGRPWSWVPRY